MGYNYIEELVFIQTLRESIEALIYGLEVAKTDILYAPAKDAVKEFYKDTSCEILNFYKALQECEANIKMHLLFWEAGNDD